MTVSVSALASFATSSTNLFSAAVLKAMMSTALSASMSCCSSTLSLPCRTSSVPLASVAVLKSPRASSARPPAKLLNRVVFELFPSCLALGLRSLVILLLSLAPLRANNGLPPHTLLNRGSHRDRGIGVWHARAVKQTPADKCAPVAPFITEDRSGAPASGCNVCGHAVVTETPSVQREK